MSSDGLKRVLFVWQSSYPWEVRIDKMATSIKERGSHVGVLCRGKAGDAVTENHEGVQLYRVMGRFNAPFPWNPVWKDALKKACADFKPTLIIVRDIPLASVAASVAKSLKIPLILDMAEHYPGAMRSWKKYQESFILRTLVHHLKLPDMVEAHAVRSIDGIITVCEEQIDRLVSQYKLPREKAVVVNNTPMRSWFKDGKIGVRSPVKVLGHHGHMTPERGLNVLLHGFALIKDEFKDLELHLAGSGESAKEVGDLINELKINDRVKLIGRFKHEELVKLYGEIDIGVLPYPPNELINHTLSNKIFDYMAMGKPVLTSSATPMTRLIKRTGAGLCFAPWSALALAESLRNILKSDLQHLSKAGVEAFTTEYHWENDFNRMSEFVDRLQSR